MVVNDPLMQRLADTVAVPVERPKVTETTALGAAFLAGLQAGLWPSLDALSKTWALDRAFRPAEDAASRDRRYAGWKDAVRRVRSPTDGPSSLSGRKGLAALGMTAGDG